MLCSPEELLQKNQALSNTWQRYQALPSFDSFVELAVSINSFTEFLIDKGITVHHASHQLGRHWPVQQMWASAPASRADD
jgi:hypothetical protein